MDRSSSGYKHLKKHNIDPNSELGKALLKLDDVYQKIEDTQKNIQLLNKQQVQLKEDAEMMEMMLMYKLNKDTRYSNGS